MKTLIRCCGMIMFLILVSLVYFNLTQAKDYDDISPQPQTISQANLPWKIQYIQREPDPVQDVGRYASLALRPFDNYPVISYYDYTNADLMVAIPIPAHSGNCGTDNNWFCDSIDGDTDDVGMFTSIDVYGDSVYFWKLGISYYDITNRALKVTIWTCSLGSCNRDYITVSASASPNIMIGLYSSFKFDSSGNAAIAYFITNSISSDSDLMYAYQVPAEGNCGEGAFSGLWECKLISISSSEGRYASLDFSYDDTPYIAYYNKDYGTLSIAYHKSGIHFCDEFDWTCLPLDGGAADVGWFASLIAPQYDGDIYRIAYYDKTNGKLKYYYDTGDPILVDDIGISLGPMGISMQLDKDGYPVIAYQKIESEFSPPALWLARPNFIYEDDESGNCGDPDYWRCIPLDTGNQYVGEAQYASLVVNSNGLMAIAYSELDDYDYFMSLKFIYQHLIRTYLPITNRQ